MGSSVIRNRAPLGPYSREMPRALWRPYGGGLFLMSEVPLYRGCVSKALENVPKVVEIGSRDIPPGLGSSPEDIKWHTVEVQ